MRGGWRVGDGSKLDASLATSYWTTVCADGHGTLSAMVVGSAIHGSAAVSNGRCRNSRYSWSDRGSTVHGRE